jgi:hypothetical protein
MLVLEQRTDMAFSLEDEHPTHEVQGCLVCSQQWMNKHPSNLWPASEDIQSRIGHISMDVMFSTH